MKRFWPVFLIVFYELFDVKSYEKWYPRRIIKLKKQVQNIIIYRFTNSLTDYILLFISLFRKYFR